MEFRVFKKNQISAIEMTFREWEEKFEYYKAVENKTAEDYEGLRESRAKMMYYLDALTKAAKGSPRWELIVDAARKRIRERREASMNRR